MMIKKIIFGLMLIASVAANAQTWKKHIIAGDELANIAPHVEYRNSDANVWLKETKNKHFEIHVFVKETYDFWDDERQTAKVGLYTPTDSLIEKIELKFATGIGSSIAWPIIETHEEPYEFNPSIMESVITEWEKTKQYKIINYLFNNEGYVRILLTSYKHLNDYKIPTFKSDNFIPDSR